MYVYNGIDISDTRLLVLNIVYSVLLLLTIFIGIVACISFYDKENLKTAKRIKALKEKALTDPVAEKQLQKLQRKYNRKVKNVRLDKIITLSLLTLLVLLNLFLCVIPGWTDYIQKDYVVFDGSSLVENGFYVHKFTSSSRIILADGTKLTGSLGLEDGEHHGRIVYSKRTKIASGFVQAN